MVEVILEGVNGVKSAGGKRPKAAAAYFNRCRNSATLLFESRLFRLARYFSFVNSKAPLIKPTPI